jgi:hypothetical protein
MRRNPQQRRLLTVVSATSTPPFNLFIINETFATEVVFQWTKQMEVTKGQVRAERQMFKKFPL